MWQELTRNNRFLVKVYNGQFQIWENITPIEANKSNCNYTRLFLEVSYTNLYDLLDVLKIYGDKGIKWI